MLLQADSARIPLRDKSVHTCVTSPPYWGLRKYSGEQGRIWGGDPECQHIWEGEEEFIAPENSTAKPDDRWASFRDSRYLNQAPFKPGHKECVACGAWYGGLGLEPTPQQHIQNIVQIMAEVHRVLRDDGVVWLNYGDCYAGSGKGAANYDGPISGKQKTNVGSMADGQGLPVFRDYPAGNLMLMPHRIAIALQDWGWVVRNDVVWWKRNPMPESVRGWSFDANTGELRKGSFRHTRAHEYIFQLVKSMQYWSNQEAVREAVEPSSIERSKYRLHGFPKQTAGYDKDKVNYINPVTAEATREKILSGQGRNPRSVMDVPTAPYSGAHYATFPPNLIAPLIRATCPRWACPVCGQGWSPVVEKGEVTGIPGEGGEGYQLAKAQEAQGTNIKGRSDGWIPNHFIPTNVKEYRATCSHPHTKDEAVPGIVLDPFVGSGTTVMVARELQREGIGLDISMEYLDQQAKIRAMNLTPSNALDELPMFEFMKG